MHIDNAKKIILPLHKINENFPNVRFTSINAKFLKTTCA